MAVGNPVSLTSDSSTTDAASYATASVSPTAGRLLLLAVASRYSTTPPTIPTITTANGITWTQVNTIVTANGDAFDNRRVTLFRAKPSSPSAGAVTIDFGGVTQLGCFWSLVEVPDTHADEASCIVQSLVTSTTAGFATSQTITLAAFASSGNMAYGVKLHWTNEATTPGSGFTEIHDLDMAEGTMGFETEYKTNDNTVDCSWATNTRHSGIAIEIAEAAAAPPASTGAMFGVF